MKIFKGEGGFDAFKTRFAIGTCAKKKGERHQSYLHIPLKQTLEIKFQV